MSSRISALEAIAGEDRGNRGIGPLIHPGELEKAAASVASAKVVAVLTGYPCCMYDPPTETDGPLGAVAMARALNALGIRVIVLTDACNQGPVSSALAASFEAYPPHATGLSEVKALPGGDIDAPQLIQEYSLDFLIAVERPGPAVDGGYYTMKGRDMSKTVAIARLEQLLDVQDESGNVLLKSIGIGDGGNELGMGKRRKLVQQFVPLGDKIGSVVATDWLITAGVSNWGGWALCFALFALGLARDGGLQEGLPSGRGELQVLRAMVQAGARDGITGRAEQTVDDLAWSEHESIITAMRTCVGIS